MHRRRSSTRERGVPPPLLPSPRPLPCAGCLQTAPGFSSSPPGPLLASPPPQQPDSGSSAARNPAPPLPPPPPRLPRVHPRGPPGQLLDGGRGAQKQGLTRADAPDPPGVEAGRARASSEQPPRVRPWRPPPICSPHTPPSPTLPSPRRRGPRASWRPAIAPTPGSGTARPRCTGTCILLSQEPSSPEGAPPAHQTSLATPRLPRARQPPSGSGAGRRDRWVGLKPKA